MFSFFFFNKHIHFIKIVFLNLNLNIILKYRDRTMQYGCIFDYSVISDIFDKEI